MDSFSSAELLEKQNIVLKRVALKKHEEMDTYFMDLIPIERPKKYQDIEADFIKRYGDKQWKEFAELYSYHKNAGDIYNPMPNYVKRVVV